MDKNLFFEGDSDMKNKTIYLLLVLVMALLLMSCGSGKTPGITSDTPTQTASAPVSVQSVISTMEKGRYVDGELLVKFKSGTLDSQSLKTHRSLGASVIRRFSSVPNLERIKIPSGLSVRNAVVKYMSDPNVEYAEPNYIKLPFVVPNDTFFDRQWALHNTGQFANGKTGADIKAPEAWDISRGGSGVVIAVLDTGIDLSHPDLIGNIDPRGLNFVGNTDSSPTDDVGHGTHVSGIIGAVGNNALGTAGLMWNVQILPLKFIGIQPPGFCGDTITICGSLADEVAAIDYLLSLKNQGANIKVMNASFGGSFSQTELAEFILLNNAGILVVAAAGNGGLDSMGLNNDLEPQYPASYNLPNIISVAATDQNDRLASFSNFGPNSVHVAAPGVYVLSTVPFTGVDLSFLSLCTGSFSVGYDFCAGTSMAAPHVAGLAGLLFSFYDGVHNTQFNHLQVRSTTLRYVDVLPTLSGSIQTGGRINAFSALSSLLSPTDLTATATSSTQIDLAWMDNATGEDGYRVERKGPTDADFIDITAGSPLPPNTTTFSDSGLSPATQYTYRVVAFNNIADSFSSNTASATTQETSTSSSSSGGGGGCSIGARQNAATAVADIAVLVIPVLIMAIAIRRQKIRK